MRRRLAVLSVALTVAVVGASAAACEDSTPSAFPEGQDPDGGVFDSGPGFNTDGNTTGKDTSGPVDCNPSLPALFKPLFTPPTKASVCSAEDLGGYFDVCLNPLDAPLCKTWREAHKTCTDCVEAEETGPIQQHLDRYYFTLNLAGCLSLERQESAAGTCPATYSDTIQCQRESCKTCLQQQGATFENYQACQGEAKKSGCKGYEDKFKQACSGIQAVDGGAYNCFLHAVSDHDKGGTSCPTAAGSPPCRDHYVRVMGLSCGQ